MECVDDLGRVLTLCGAPQRIVSLVPSITETLFTLGMGAAVVGITRFCTEPSAQVAGVAKVGGTKNPDLAAVVGLRPDLVIVNAEENRREDFARLVAEGLRVYVTFPRVVEEAISMIERLGRAVGAADRALRMAGELRRVFAQVSASGNTERRLRVFCPVWRKPWMSFNGDTYIDNVLWCSGGENVLRREGRRFFPIELERVAHLEPEVVLLPDEPFPFSSRHVRELKPLAATPAGRGGHVYCVDGKALSWYGPRIGEGLRHLHGLFAQVRATLD